MDVRNNNLREPSLNGHLEASGLRVELELDPILKQHQMLSKLVTLVLASNNPLSHPVLDIHSTFIHNMLPRRVEHQTYGEALPAIRDLPCSHSKRVSADSSLLDARTKT